MSVKISWMNEQTDQEAKRMRNIPITVVLCLAVAGLVMGQKVAKDLEDVISEASIWVDWKPDDSLYPKQDGKKALGDGTTCMDKIDEALSKGLSESTVVETQKGKMTIAEARVMCVKVRDA